MTVVELIERLQRFPRDAVVMVYGEDEDFSELHDDGLELRDVDMYEVGTFRKITAVRIIGSA